MEIKNEEKWIKQLGDSIESFQDPDLTIDQKKLCKRYFQMLVQTNELHNLTAITDPDKIVSHHLKDSLSVVTDLDFENIPGLVDVGSGAGLPGIPVKIYAPEVPMILIEVNQKKIAFLQRVIDELGLRNIVVYPHDWRTFLRKTKFDVTVFLSRASLHPEELLRMFKPTSFYRDALLVYYASEHWQSSKTQEPYVDKRVSYKIDHKMRILVFFKNIPTMNQKEKK